MLNCTTGGILTISRTGDTACSAAPGRGRSILVERRCGAGTLSSHCPPTHVQRHDAILGTRGREGADTRFLAPSPPD